MYTVRKNLHLSAFPISKDTLDIFTVVYIAIRLCLVIHCTVLYNRGRKCSFSSFHFILNKTFIF
jgi:hypothetical protein